MLDREAIVGLGGSRTTAHAMELASIGEDLYKTSKRWIFPGGVPGEIGVELNRRSITLEGPVGLAGYAVHQAQNPVNLGHFEADLGIVGVGLEERFIQIDHGSSMLLAKPLARGELGQTVGNQVELISQRGASDPELSGRLLASLFGTTIFESQSPVMPPQSYQAEQEDPGRAGDQLPVLPYRACEPSRKGLGIGRDRLIGQPVFEIVGQDAGARRSDPRVVAPSPSSKSLPELGRHQA